MNIPRILELATVISALPFNTYNFPGTIPSFQLCSWHNSCGTPQCIAAHAIAHFAPEEYRRLLPLNPFAAHKDWITTGAKVLDLSFEDAKNLFLPINIGDAIDIIQPSEAVQALRLLVETQRSDPEILYPKYFQP